MEKDCKDNGEKLSWVFLSSISNCSFVAKAQNFGSMNGNFNEGCENVRVDTRVKNIPSEEPESSGLSSISSFISLAF